MLLGFWNKSITKKYKRFYFFFLQKIVLSYYNTIIYYLNFR